jgi:hypothetical protein
VSRRKKSGSSRHTAIPRAGKKSDKPDRSRVTAEPEVQHLLHKRGLTQRQIRDLIRERLIKATELLSGGHVEFYPPAIDSADGIGPKNIQVTFHYVIEEISTFRFRRRNLTLGTTKEIDFVVNPGSYTHMFNDNGLDPATSYTYQVAAVHPPDFPVLAGYVYWNTSQIPVTATTLDTAGDLWFETTLLYDSAGWEGRCLVQRIEPRVLSQGGTQFQLTLRASSSAPYGAFIDRVTIGRWTVGAGKPYDSADVPREVAPKFDIRGGESLTLPWVPFKLPAQDPLLVAVDFKYPPWPSAIRYRPVKPLLRVGTAYWRAGAEAALSPRSENYQAENRIYLIERIQVR